MLEIAEILTGTFQIFYLPVDLSESRIPEGFHILSLTVCCNRATAFLSQAAGQMVGGEGNKVPSEKENQEDQLGLTNLVI